jgi:hypothetical protein
MRAILPRGLGLLVGALIFQLHTVWASLVGYPKRKTLVRQIKLTIITLLINGSSKKFFLTRIKMKQRKRKRKILRSMMRMKKVRLSWIWVSHNWETDPKNNQAKWDLTLNFLKYCIKKH